MLFHVLIFLKSRCALQLMRWGLWSLGKSGDCSFRRISASRAFRLWPLPIPQSLDARGPHSFLFRSQIISSGSSHVPGCGKFQFTSFFLSSVPGHWPRVHPGEAPQDPGPPPGHRLTPRPVTPTCWPFTGQERAGCPGLLGGAPQSTSWHSDAGGTFLLTLWSEWCFVSGSFCLLPIPWDHVNLTRYSDSLLLCMIMDAVLQTSFLYWSW